MSRKIGDKTYLSPNEVAERMGVSLRTVQRWISRGGVISSPWFDPGTARRRTWHQTRPPRETAGESTDKPKRSLLSGMRMEYRDVRQSTISRQILRFLGEEQGELRLSFITDPSSGFHYFPEDEVMKLVKHLTDEGSDFWRVRRAVEALEWREKREARERERAAGEPTESQPAPEEAGDAADESGPAEKTKPPRAD